MNLKEIQQPVEHLLVKTNSILKEKVKSDIRLLNMMIDLTPITKGKKIRSTLFYLLSGLKTPAPNPAESHELIEIASAVEMFHLSSLIHDDIMDNSEKRRGEKTLNTNIGNFRSVLWGDYLFISAFTAIHNIGKPFLLDTVLKTAKIMVEGQIIEVENAYNFDIDLETYYDIINRKTSSLFAAVALLVPLLHGESQQQKDLFYQFGLNFGTIFQVSDDMLDIFSTQSGKDRFRDLEEGKLTLPFILLMKETADAQEAFSQGNREKLLELFEKHKIKELCLEKIADYHGRCLDFLKSYPDSVFKESLLGLLDFVKYRDY
ncbi:MAG TPA: polyprenyl synthetase family protein [Candidatus Kapabacteria bacterium]|nr:polyprenyl synthetase family protein [Candidatus Kapabacteria bacterium]